MKCITWNVNGLRAILKKNFYSFLKDEAPDILCLQETKLQEDQIPTDFMPHQALKPYKAYWHCAQKKGYSGVGILSKTEPLSVIKGFEGSEKYDVEGRLITLEYKDYYVLSAYFPNSQEALKRLDYKLGFNREFLRFVVSLNQKKPVISCGDFNVAHEEIDLKNPKTNTMNPGFYIDERKWFTEILSKPFVDIFRHRHPREPDHYTWWSYRHNARVRNIGWRIDYFVITSLLVEQVKACEILKNVTGSDHCPVTLEILVD